MGRDNERYFLVAVALQVAKGPDVKWSQEAKYLELALPQNEEWNTVKEELDDQSLKQAVLGDFVLQSILNFLRVEPLDLETMKETVDRLLPSSISDDEDEEGNSKVVNALHPLVIKTLRNELLKEIKRIKAAKGAKKASKL